MPLWSSIKHALIMRDRAIFRAVSIIDSLLKDSLFIVVINFLRQAALDSHRVKNGSADISLLAFFRINGCQILRAIWTLFTTISTSASSSPR